MSRRVAAPPTRRDVLRLAVLLPAGPLLVACRTADVPPVPPAPDPAPDPDVALLQAALDRELSLMQRYDDALAATSGPAASRPAGSRLAASLAALRAEHAVHVAALGAFPTPAGTAPDPITPRASATRRLSATGRPGSVLAALAEQERLVSGAHARDALVASRELAAVLATLAASEASHVVALT